MKTNGLPPDVPGGFFHNPDPDGHYALARRLHATLGYNCGATAGLIWIEYPPPRGLQFKFPAEARAILGFPPTTNTNGTP